MPLHLTRVAFACRTLADIAAAAERFALRLPDGRRVGRVSSARFPRRAAELVGGSLYWIIANTLVARQAILDVVPRPDGPGAEIRLALDLVPVEPTPRRAHQGWRYLEPAEAPPDFDSQDPLPPALRRELASLGLA